MKKLNKTFFDEVKKFISLTDPQQVEILNAIYERATNKYQCIDLEIAYMMSTGWHEAQLRTVREGFRKTDRGARAFVKRQGYRYAKESENGQVHYGRGIVQLTHPDNYINMSKEYGVDFYNQPDLALKTEYAVPLLVDGMLKGWYNGKKKGLGYYLNRNKPDWKNARRTVNITDKWTRFRNTALRFNKALQAARKAETEKKTSVIVGGGAVVTAPVLSVFEFSSTSIILASVLGLTALTFGFVRFYKDKYYNHVEELSV